MSDEIKEVDQHEEKIIITDNPEKEKNLLDIDTNALSNKELLKFDRNDLLEIAKSKNLLNDLKDWEIDRITKPKLVKRLKSSSAAASKKVKESTNENTSQESKIDILLLQSAIIDIITKSDSTNLDLFAAKTLQNNDEELISEDSAVKIEKGLVYFSMGHMIVKSMGGYKNIFTKVKEFYTKYKERKNNATD